LSKDGVKLTDAEKAEIQGLLGGDEQEFNEYMKRLSMTTRAIQGKPVDVGTVVTRLVDVTNILERSRFPTYTTIRLQVYLRLIHEIYGDVADSCLLIADLLAQGLISYKGGSREEWMKQMQHAQGPQEAQNIYLGQSGEPQRVQQPKRRFWQRTQKPPHEELQDK